MLNGNKKYILILLMSVGIFSCKKKDDETTTLQGTWYEKSNFEGVARSNAATFTVGSKAYLGTGFDGTSRLNDFWEYDPATNFWQQKADFPGAARNEAVGFSIDGLGYMGTGYNGTTMYKDFYSYNPANNTWSSIADLASTA